MVTDGQTDRQTSARKTTTVTLAAHARRGLIICSLLLMLLSFPCLLSYHHITCYLAQVCWSGIRSCLCCLLSQLHWRVSQQCIHDAAKMDCITPPTVHLAVLHRMRTTSGWATLPETCKSCAQCRFRNLFTAPFIARSSTSDKLVSSLNCTKKENLLQLTSPMCEGY